MKHARPLLREILPFTTARLIAAGMLAASLAQAAPPDLTGVWSIVNPPHVLKTVEGLTPPLTPAAQVVYEQHLAAAARGDRSFDGVTRCLPPGLPRLMLVNEPFEILQRPKAMYFLHQLNRLPWRAYFGEKLPQDPDPLWLGYSVARWDGDTLIIDSTGFYDSTILDDSGLPHSTALRLIEQYRLSADRKHLEALFTIDDPKTYTRPWTAQAEYVRRPGLEIREEFCMDQLLHARSTAKR
ncbi:MAG TPA: hypothetical protein VMU67_02575 [Steroidobacteraceae bacterium]|nr:hypothetical protein [Steroidobacteraceae bacterium]